MQFSNKKKALAGAMIAVGGLALVGVGTGAVFTDTVTANSTVKAGIRRPRHHRRPELHRQHGRQHRDPQAGACIFNTPGYKSDIRHLQGD